MKVKEVPQDLKYYEGSVIRDLAYAVDEDGNYQSLISDGWEAKNEALQVTLDEINEESERIKQLVLEGKTSPLEYHAKVNLMDVSLLSKYTGFSKRKIRRHFNADVFRSLDVSVLERYAEVLRMKIEDLVRIPG